MQRIFPGKNGVVRAVELKTSKGTLESPVQHLYPIELAKESTKLEPKPLNPKADDFRPKRKAAVEANDRIQANAEYEEKQSLDIRSIMTLLTFYLYFSYV